METTALIMAGGRGERFWPKSRKSTPKQFLPLTEPGRTMIQSTVERILPLVGTENILIATNRDYENLVRTQLPEIPAGNILSEPSARNTAPCIGWGAVTVRKKYGDALMMVLPSDHLIRQPALFRGALKNALRIAGETDALVTLGITPSAADTGYGYIQYDTEETGLQNAFRVRKFVEKPDADTARSYLASGDFLWNSGMFVWKASAILREIQEKLPDLYGWLETVEKAIGTDREADVLNEAFGAVLPISIDYGVMEKAKRVYVLPSSFGWDDVGSWLAVGRLAAGDSRENVISGDVVTAESARCIVQGGTRLTALVGMEDTIVVDTEDVLLVCAKDHAGDIRKVLDTLKADGREELL